MAFQRPCADYEQRPALFPIWFLFQNSSPSEELGKQSSTFELESTTRHGHLLPRR